MDRIYVAEKTFDKIDYTGQALPVGDYENCSFVNCNLSNTNLSNINFSECEFKACNLSLAKLTKTTFGNIKFIDCKLLGLHFMNCNEFLFSVDFENCILNLSSFYKLKVVKTKFKNSSLEEVDFTETDLNNSLFDNCNLSRTIFANSILEKTDFRTSFNYSIDPESNRIRKAKFSLAGIIGLLDKYDIVVE